MRCGMNRNLRNYFALGFAGAILFLSACRKETKTPVDPAGNNASVIVPEGFDFSTTKEVTVRVSISDNAGKPLKGVRVRLMDKSPQNGGTVFFTGTADETGLFESAIRVPSYINEILVNTDYIGLSENVIVPVKNNRVEVTYRGGNTTEQFRSADTDKISGQDFSFFGKAGLNFRYLGGYTTLGVPTYLEPVRDNITSSFLADLNYSLPSTYSVPVYNPSFLDPAYLHDLVVDQLSDVWITFVHEGAGLTNTLCYYTYNVNNPPATVNDIDTITVVFPNVSYLNSGGGLVTGDKVKIGRFPANTVIGFVLIAGGFSNGQVGTGFQKYFTNPHLNPETDPTLKQHHVMLNDLATKRMLIGFEDIKRDQVACDHDFNDAVFYASSNPVQAFDTNHVNTLIPFADCDNDGVGDLYDEYKCDPSRAYNNYYPGTNIFGTLAFEDLWPAQGDYDMNDLSVGYNFNRVTNAANRVVELKARFMVRASGASFKNGFGFEMPVASSTVSNVTGHSLLSNYISLAANKTEAGQSKAVVIAFDNQYDIIKRPGGQYVNTETGTAYITGDTVKMTVSFTTPLTTTALGLPPFNPFIIANQQRGNEIHLPNKAPTNKANTLLFGTLNDRSNPASGTYYKDQNGMPWALDIPTVFRNPTEKTNITGAYLKFSTWAASGGVSFNDWYLDLPTYRNNSKIY